MVNLRLATASLLLLAILGLLAHGDAGTVVTRVILPDTSGVVGDRIRVNLDMADVDTMHAATIDIVFDPAVAAPLPGSLRLGPLAESVPEPRLYGASTPADSVFRIAWSAADSLVGSGTFMTFEIELVGEGASPLRFDRITLERMPDIQLPASGEPGSMVVGPAAVEEGTWGRVKQRYGGSQRVGGRS